MLILTRRIGESLMIGDDVAVTVLGVKGNQVRIGIDAPREVAVHRREIYERIQDRRSEQSGGLVALLSAAVSTRRRTGGQRVRRLVLTAARPAPHPARRCRAEPVGRESARQPRFAGDPPFLYAPQFPERWPSG